MASKDTINKCKIVGIVALCFVLFGSHLLLASEEQPRILILNSDMSVKGQYLSVQTAFIEAIPYPSQDIKAIDLGKKWRTPSKIFNEIRHFRPDLTYCIGSQACMLTQKEPTPTKLVFSSVINWEKFFSDQSPAFGVTSEIPYHEQLAAFHDFFPDIHSIGVLYSNQFNKKSLLSIHKSARQFGFEIIEARVSQKGAARTTIASVLAKIDALWILPDPLAVSGFDDVTAIFELTGSHKKPVFAWSSGFVKQGAVMAVEADTHEVGRQAAKLSVQILTGESISKPIQAPKKKLISVNLKKIKSYDLEFNNNLLSKIIRVVE